MHGVCFSLEFCCLLKHIKAGKRSDMIYLAVLGLVDFISTVSGGLSGDVNYIRTSGVQVY